MKKANLALILLGTDNTITLIQDDIEIGTITCSCTAEISATEDGKLKVLFNGKTHIIEKTDDIQHSMKNCCYKKVGEHVREQMLKKYSKKECH